MFIHYTPNIRLSAVDYPLGIRHLQHRIRQRLGKLVRKFFFSPPPSLILASVCSLPSPYPPLLCCDLSSRDTILSYEMCCHCRVLVIEYEYYYFSPPNLYIKVKIIIVIATPPARLKRVILGRVKEPTQQSRSQCHHPK